MLGFAPVSGSPVSDAGNLYAPATPIPTIQLRWFPPRSEITWRGESVEDLTWRGESAEPLTWVNVIDD